MAIQYPILDDFSPDMLEVCQLYKKRYPNGPQLFTGSPVFRYAEPDFEFQDSFHDMELCSQQRRNSVLSAQEGSYQVEGLGLPFELLYFEARDQLRKTADALMRERAEREYERDLLVVDDFNFIDACLQQLPAGTVGLNAADYGV